MKIKCKNCGNVASLVKGVCDKCEVKADYVEIKEVKNVSKKKEND